MGPIGVALNGIPFYNQYGAGGNPLDQEINSFDQYNGHPAPGQSGGRYHYHMEPFWLTENYGKDSFMGFLLYGFPIFGPEENGLILTSSDLDEFHGHFHENQDFPNGTYAYFSTVDNTTKLPTFPYITLNHKDATDSFNYSIFNKQDDLTLNSGLYKRNITPLGIKEKYREYPFLATATDSKVTLKIDSVTKSGISSLSLIHIS